jgi:hypothetical protein
MVGWKIMSSSTGPTGGATGKFAYGGLLDGNGDGVNVAILPFLILAQ